MTETQNIEPIRSSEDLGRLIRGRRRDANLTQADLAGIAMTTTRLVSEIERGKRTAQIDGILRITSALGIQLEARMR